MCFWSTPEVAAKLTEEDTVMSLELFERVIDQAKIHAHKFGLTDSGEFMMDPLWTERLKTISAIAKADPATMFHQITNASLLTKKNLRHLAGLKNVTLLISIESLDPLNYASIRSPGKLHQVLANIRNLRTNLAEIGVTNVQLQLSMVLMKRNIFEIPKLIELAKEIDAYLFVDHAQGFGPQSLASESMFNYPAFCNIFLEQCKALARNIGVDIYVPPPFAIEENEISQYFEEKNKGGLTCSSLNEWGPIAIMPNGDMKVCCGELVFGNVNESSFEDIYFSEKFSLYRNAIQQGKPLPPCDSCRFLFMSSSYLYDSEVYDLSIPPQERNLDPRPDFFKEGFFDWIKTFPVAKLHSHIAKYHQYESSRLLDTQMGQQLEAANAAAELRRKLLKLIQDRSKVVLYPAGSRAMEMLCSPDELIGYCNIVAISDKNPQKQSTKIMGLSVIPPQQIAEHGPTAVIIAVSNPYVDDILKELQPLKDLNIDLLVV